MNRNCTIIPPIDRFRRAVHIDDVTGCHIWKLWVTEKGYGKFNAGGKQVRAHRWIWEYHNGEIPKDVFVCHKCDNPRCVNIDHLFIGTALDNNKDKFRKGRLRLSDADKEIVAANIALRFPKPTRKANSTPRGVKLTQEKADEIRSRLISGDHYVDIANDYGVSACHIFAIKHNRVWANSPPPNR